MCVLILSRECQLHKEEERQQSGRSGMQAHVQEGEAEGGGCTVAGNLQISN